MPANESVARCCTGLHRDKIRTPLRSVNVRRLTESPKQRDPIRWRLGVYAAIAMAFLALLPQFHLWASRGNEWQGTFVSFDFDEVAYASYLNALISGRPRHNDPYSGRDDALNQPQSESLYSIQFVPAYVLALPARAFGLSSATTFILLRGLAAFVATLALFWLLVLITGDERLAAGGAIAVLCLGGLAGEPHDAWRILTFQGVVDSLPFLRRFVPASVFFLFFMFAGLVWRALAGPSPQVRLTYAALAGLTLAILIFSYFFLWTAALAWLFIVAVLWLIVRRRELGSVIAVLAVIMILFAAALWPYAVLLSRRNSAMDASQLLTHSRAPVFSFPVVIGLLVFLVLATAVWRSWLRWRDPAVLFATSFALLPAVTFNQQLVTGLLLQPVHYGRYIANYASVLAIVIVAGLIWRARSSSGRLPSRVFAFVAIVIFGWSALENGVRAYRMGPQSRARDDGRRVAMRLRELSLRTPSTQRSDQTSSLVFCSNLWLGDALPNDAPQPVLWTPHLFIFPGSSADENRERLYRQLYYSDVDEEQFATLARESSFLQLAVFGWERMNQKSYAAPIADADVQKETSLYKDYLANFNASQAAATPLGYVIVPSTNGSLSNLDLWYSRDDGEQVGDYILYRVKLK